MAQRWVMVFFTEEGRQEKIEQGAMRESEKGWASTLLSNLGHDQEQQGSS
ncbi:fatty acid desaturase [Sesbania bispinosa]|nr:fatty acid desaturase [Sesbania bispinosa]